MPAAVNDRIPIPGWLGPSNPTRTGASDSERTVNLYPEITSPGTAKSQATLYGTPGLTLFSQTEGTPGPLSDSPNLGEVSYGYGGTDRTLCIAGTTLFEIFQDGSWVVRGNVAINQPVHWAFNTFQVAIATGLGFYCFDFSTNTLTTIQYTVVNADGSTSAGDFFAAADTEYIDGYLFALVTGTNRVNASNIFDGTFWNALNYTTRQGSSDPLVGLAAHDLQLWMLGQETTEVWYDAGVSPGFPFLRVQGGFLQRGLAAPSTVIEMDDGLFWIGRMTGGGPIAYRNQGYAAVRLSNNAVEYQWNQYPNITSAICSYYVEEGHQFLLAHFPDANGGLGATWVYDTATNLWHERLFWDTVNSVWSADPARYITYAWGMQIVADYRNGNICLQSLETYTTLDAGGNAAPIRRRRTAPPIASTMNWIYYHEFELDCQTGIDLPVPPAQGSNPQAVLRFSDDGGYTWSTEIWAPLGQVGQTIFRVLWRRLGKSRDRVFEVTISDPIPVALINAYVRLSAGSGL